MTDVPERAGGDAGVTGDHAGDTAGPVGPTRRRRGGTDRGVSEVIAFVLVFSIVVVSIGLLYTVGFGGISQLQETEQDHSGERAMRAFAVALEDIQADRGSVRQARLELAGRTITVDESSELTVSVGGGTPVTAEGAFTYVGGGDTEIAYHSGAVIRSQGPDAQLVQRPPMIRCTDEHAVLSLVNVTQVETGSFSSGGAVDIRAEQVNAREEQVVAQASGSPTVDVDYSSSGYATAWERYFTEQGWVTSSGSATCEADSVYVRMTEIQLEYIGV